MTTAPSTLLRRPDTPAPRAAVPAPAITITGALREDAYAAVEAATGRAAIHITIGQGAGRPAITAVQWWADERHESALHAHELARSLCAGDIVTVHARGICSRYSRGAIVLALIGAYGIAHTLRTNHEERHP